MKINGEEKLDLAAFYSEWGRSAGIPDATKSLKSLEYRQMWERRVLGTAEHLLAACRAGKWAQLPDFLCMLRDALQKFGVGDELWVAQLRIFSYDCIEKKVLRDLEREATPERADIADMCRHFRSLTQVSCFLESPNLFKLFEDNQPIGGVKQDNQPIGGVKQDNQPIGAVKLISDAIQHFWDRDKGSAQSDEDAQCILAISRLSTRLFGKHLSREGEEMLKQQLSELTKAELCRANTLWDGKGWQPELPGLLAILICKWEGETGEEAYYQGRALPKSEGLQRLGAALIPAAGGAVEWLLKYWKAKGKNFWAFALKRLCDYDFMPVPKDDRPQVELPISIGLDVNILVAGERASGKSSMLFALKHLKEVEIKGDPSDGDALDDFSKKETIWKSGGPASERGGPETWRTKWSELYATTTPVANRSAVRLCYFDLPGEDLGRAAGVIKCDQIMQKTSAEHLRRYLEHNHPRALVVLLRPPEQPAEAEKGLDWEIPELVLSHLLRQLRELAKLTSEIRRQMPVILLFNQTDRVIKTYESLSAAAEKAGTLRRQLLNAPKFSKTSESPLFPIHCARESLPWNEHLAGNPELRSRLLRDLASLDKVLGFFKEAEFSRFYLSYTQTSPGGDAAADAATQLKEWDSTWGKSLQESWNFLTVYVADATRKAARQWFDENIIDFLETKQHELQDSLESFKQSWGTSGGITSAPASPTELFDQARVPRDADLLRTGRLTWDKLVPALGGNVDSDTLGHKIKETCGKWQTGLEQAKDAVKIVLQWARLQAGVGTDGNGSGPTDTTIKLNVRPGDDFPYEALSQILTTPGVLGRGMRDTLKLYPGFGILRTNAPQLDKETTQADLGKVWQGRRSNQDTWSGAWWRNFVFHRFSQDFCRYRSLHKWLEKGDPLHLPNGDLIPNVTLEACDQLLIRMILPMLAEVDSELDTSLKVLGQLRSQMERAYVLMLLRELDVNLANFSGEEGWSKLSRDASAALCACRRPPRKGGKSWMPDLFRDVDTTALQAILGKALNQVAVTHLDDVARPQWKLESILAIASRTEWTKRLWPTGAIKSQDIDLVSAGKFAEPFPMTPDKKCFQLPPDGEIPVVVAVEIPRWQTVHQLLSNYVVMAVGLMYEERMRYWQDAGWEIQLGGGPFQDRLTDEDARKNWLDGRKAWAKIHLQT